MYIKQGFGFTVGYDFARAAKDTPIEIDAGAFPQKGYAFGWIAGDKQSALGFMRRDRVRVCVRKDGLLELEERDPEAERIVAVNKAIEASNRAGRRCGGREARAIHALLKGWR